MGQWPTYSKIGGTSGLWSHVGAGRSGQNLTPCEVPQAPWNESAVVHADEVPCTMSQGMGGTPHCFGDCSILWQAQSWITNAITTFKLR